MAERIFSVIQKDMVGGQIRWRDFMGYMQLLLAQTFTEKLDLFFETFDINGDGSFTWDEIFKIAKSCLAQMFLPTPVQSTASSEQDLAEDDFLINLASYFTKFIFETVGCELDAEIPLDEMKEAIKQAKGKESDILKMFCCAD